MFVRQLFHFPPKSSDFILLGYILYLKLSHLFMKFQIFRLQCNDVLLDFQIRRLQRSIQRFRSTHDIAS